MRLKVQVGQFGGFTKLFFSKLNMNCLVAASTMGDTCIIDPRNGAILKTIKGNLGPVNDIIELALEDGTQLLVTAGDDSQCLVFNDQSGSAPTPDETLTV